jgi:hypothetical protein
MKQQNKLCFCRIIKRVTANVVKKTPERESLDFIPFGRNVKIDDTVL